MAMTDPEKTSRRRKKIPDTITQTLRITPEATLTQMYDFVFRSSDNGIIVTDESGLIQMVNPAAAAMLAMHTEELVAKKPDDCLQHNPALLNLFTREGEQTLDIRLPKRRIAVGVGRTLNSNERVIILQDVTEKRELESRRESLIQRMTHDLRNPISAIIGFGELVGKYGDLNDQQRKFLMRLRQTTNKLYDVVGSLVDLAWIEAGMPLAHRPTQMSTVIDKAVNQISSLALERHITVAISVQTPLPVIMGDPERLQIVIYHLLQNAIIYSDPEQTVAIHAWGDDNDVYCSVGDRGIGIADDELDKIFDRMYRSRDERVRDTPGGGLGLTIAKTIVQRHGGDMWAASNLGQGSTFTFVLPTVRL
jgi:signal transduction histidine kinase